MAEECRSCHAQIWWCEKEPAEFNEKGLPKTMPVDAGSVGGPTGNIECWSEPVIPVSGGTPAYVLKFRYLKKTEQPAEGRKRAVSHFSTCPDAPKWRRK